MRTNMNIPAKLRVITLSLCLIVIHTFVLAQTIYAQPEEEGPPPVDEIGGREQGVDKSSIREQRRMERRKRFAEGGEGMHHGGEGFGPGGKGRFEDKGFGSGRMGRMGHFLGFMDKYVDSVQDPYKAVGLAVIGIREHYKRSKNPQEALGFFQDLLSKTKDQKMRNILLFTIRQTHEANKDQEKMLEINKQIIKENLEGK